MNYPNNRSNPANNRTMLPGTIPLSQVSVIPIPRNDSSPIGLVTIYDPHQHEPGQPSALQKRRCRTIVALALIIWGLFITVYIFITSPDDPVRCNEYNICNNHYLMFFVGPILLFTGCSMACYNFMTYGGCCHSIKPCNPDDACGRIDARGQNQDVSIFPNAIRNYMAAAAANNTGPQMDGPPAYQCVVAEPWKFLGATKALHNYEHSDHNPASQDLHSSKELKDYSRSSPDDREYNDADASTDDIEPPPYNVITSNGTTYFARNSISTQTQLDLSVSPLNNSTSSSSLPKDNIITAPMSVADQKSHLAILNVERPKPYAQIRRKSNSIACLPSIDRENNEPNVKSHNSEGTTRII